jgi:DNA ligase-1
VTRLAELVATSHRVAATSGRRAKVRELAALLERLEPAEIGVGVNYLSGEIPQGKIGLGYATLAAAATPAASSADAAAVAANADPEFVGAESLSVADVDLRLTELAGLRGGGSSARRAEALRELFSRATPPEQEFLLRLLSGELRQGALAGVMQDAIAAAARVPAHEIRRATMYAGSLGAVAVAALNGGSAALSEFQLQLFAPVAPMLAGVAVDVDEALELLSGEAAFEWKMDGARIQVHKRDDEVRIYTRGLNEITAAVPEIVEAARGFSERSLVLDGEAIAFDAGGRPHPFQITMKRFGRKQDVAASRLGLPLRAFFFDCLRLGENTLTAQSTHERYEALSAAVPAELLMPRLITDSRDAARAFYEAALAAGHEGVMAKSLDAPYEAGNRGSSWLKIKRVHTLDLVVLAAEWGHGRRAGKLSNLHLGALDPGSGHYVMLGKTFKGLTDAMLEWQTRELLARETHRDVGTVYVRPELVVEIAFSDFQASVRYPGGLALRLARVKRYRDDKPAAEADTMDSVRRVYAAQSLSR